MKKYKRSKDRSGWGGENISRFFGDYTNYGTEREIEEGLGIGAMVLPPLESKGLEDGRYKALVEEARKKNSQKALNTQGLNNGSSVNN